jgi:hypothetical protein
MELSHMLKGISDKLRGVESVFARRILALNDGAKHQTRYTIYKFKDEDGKVEELLKQGITQETIAEMFPQRLVEITRFKGPAWHPGNLCLNSGIQGFEKLIAGLSSPPSAWNNANAYLGVGDSSTAAAASQTDLQASTNYAYVGMQASYPSQASQAVSWQASFGSAVANYAWNEFVVSNASTKGSGVCLNRLVSSQGTKTSGQTWVLTVSITWS